MIKAVNEPIKEYLPGSDEKTSIKKQLEKISSECIDIPIIIGGKEIRTNDLGECVMPHNHKHILAHYHKASSIEVDMAINNLMETWKTWSKTQLRKGYLYFKKWQNY